MSTGINNELIAAIQIAQLDASARFSAASTASMNAAQAQRDVANTEAGAQKAVANTEAGARRDVANIEAGAQRDVAKDAADAQTTSAQTAADAQRDIAHTAANAQTSSATTMAEAQKAVANIDSSWHAAVANIEASAQANVANIEANAQTTAASYAKDATIQASANSQNATIQASANAAGATRDAAISDAGARVGAAQLQSQATIAAANADAAARTTVASTEATASNYRADREYAGVVLEQQTAVQLLNAKLSFANDKFTAVFPLISDVATGVANGTVTGGSGGAGFHAQAPSGPIGFAGAHSTVGDAGDFQVGHYSRRYVGGLARSEPRMGSGDVKTGGIGFASGDSVADAVAGTQLPCISTSGVLTPAQVQQQVNAAYARNDARTQSEVRKLTGDLAGRGFSSSSPILAALQVGLVGQGLRASLQAATQVRLDAAKLNGEAVFNAQKAVSDQFIQQENVLLDDAKNQVTRTVGVLSAVAQMIGGAL